MVAEELINNVEALQLQGSGYEELQDFDHEEEEEEEILSLCDLAAHCRQESEDYSFINDGFSKEEESVFDEDFFEFFSEDFAASTYPKDNILFCGKLISYKEHPVREQTQITKNTIVTKQEKLLVKKQCVFPWKKSLSFNKARPKPTSAKQQQRREKCKSQKNDCDNDFPMKKASPTASPIKSRWYLLAFTYGRFPTDLDQKDMKRRQNRRNNIPYATMFRLDSKSCEKIETGNEKRSSGRCLWRLLRVLKGFGV